MHVQRVRHLCRPCEPAWAARATRRLHTRTFGPVRAEFTPKKWYEAASRRLTRLLITQRYFSP